MKTEELSQDLSLLIPMWNEEGVIRITLEDIITAGLHKRYRIVVCDDDSTDQSVIEAQTIASACCDGSISIVHNTPNGRKVGAIKKGLEYIRTPYVLLMDADSIVIESISGNFDRLVEKMRIQNLVAVTFKIRPIASTLLEHLQALDYLLFTDSVRRLLGVIVCLVGQGVLWDVDGLKTVLEHHSGFFEGDDLESTMLATIYDYHEKQVEYEPHMAIIVTRPKKTLEALIRQRAYIWDVGLIRTFWDMGIKRLFRNNNNELNQNGLHQAFFRSVFITEVVAHPFKVLTTVSLCLIILLLLLGKSIAISSHMFTGLSQLEAVSFGVLKATSFVYVLLWLFNMISIVRLRLSPRHLLLCLYFTFYMATPIIPLLGSNFTQVIGIAYLWWYGLCVVLILVSSEPIAAKLRWLIWGLLMPFYYATLLILSRTLGFAIYILKRVYTANAG